MKSEMIKEFLVGLGFKIDEAGMARFISNISQATVAVTAMGAATTAAATAIFVGVKKIADQYYELEKLGIQFRTSAESVDQFIDAAEIMGINNDVTIDSLKNLDRAVIDTSLGLGRTKLIFEKIGLSVFDAAGNIKSTTQVMAELVQMFKTMERGEQLRVMERLGLDTKLIKVFNADLDGLNKEIQAIENAAGLDFDQAIKQSKLFTYSFRLLQQEVEKWRTLFLKALDVIAIKMMPKLRHAMDRVRHSMIGLRQTMMDAMPRIIANIVPVVSAILRISQAFITIASRIVSSASMIVGWILKLNNATNGWAGYIAMATLAWKYLNMAFLKTPLGQLIALASVIALLIDDFLTFREGGDSLIDWGSKFGGLMKVITGIMTLFIADLAISKAAFFGVAIATKAWASATAVLNGVLAAARIAVLVFNMALSLNPIGAVVAAVSLLVGAGVLLVKNWDTVKKWFVGFFDFILRGFDKMVNIGQKIAGIVGFGNQPRAMLTPSVQTQAASLSKAQSINQQTQIVVQGNKDPMSTARAISGQQNRVNADLARNMRAVAR